MDIMRTRYFFHGLTEEVVKRTAPGWAQDTAFAFTSHEDGGGAVEHNSLGVGAVGHIACARGYAPGAGGNGATGLVDAFYFYDHIGNVQGASDASGALASTTAQDAWGNVLASTTTGAWASSPSSRHLTTKEYDPDSSLYYFWQRWYSNCTSILINRCVLLPDQEHSYQIGAGSPIVYYDSTGMKPQGRCRKAEPVSSDSGICDIYSCEDHFMGWSAKCVCERAGESKWDQYVRGCLACLHGRRIRSDIAHSVCYSWADARYGQLAGLLARTDIGFRLNYYCLFSSNLTGSPLTTPMPPWAVAP